MYKCSPMHCGNTTLRDRHANEKTKSQQSQPLSPKYRMLPAATPRKLKRLSVVLGVCFVLGLLDQSVGRGGGAAWLQGAKSRGGRHHSRSVFDAVRTFPTSLERISVSVISSKGAYNKQYKHTTLLLIQPLSCEIWNVALQRKPSPV